MIETIKMAAVEAVKASNPAAILFGTVKSITPLRINVEQRLTLDEAHLILTSLVSDFEVEMTSNDVTNVYTVHLGLEIDDVVILLQVQGGQKYIILDRVR